MVRALALVLGLVVMDGDYVGGGGAERARGLFMRDFRLSFGEEVGGDE